MASSRVERQNRAIVKRFKIAHLEGNNWQKELQKFLLMFRSTPHFVTNIPPSRAQFNRNIRSKLPEIDKKILNNQELRDAAFFYKETGRVYAEKES